MEGVASSSCLLSVDNVGDDSECCDWLDFLEQQKYFQEYPD